MKSYRITVDSRPTVRAVIVWRSDTGSILAKKGFTGNATKALRDFVNYVVEDGEIEPGDTITIENLED